MLYLYSCSPKDFIIGGKCINSRFSLARVKAARTILRFLAGFGSKMRAFSYWRLLSICLFYAAAAAAASAFLSESQSRVLPYTLLTTKSRCKRLEPLQAHGTSDGGEDSSNKQTKHNSTTKPNNGSNNKKIKKTDNLQPSYEEDKARKRKEIAKAAARLLKRKEEATEAKSILQNLNPFQAGKQLRRTVEGAISSLSRASGGTGVSSDSRQKSIYYLDDRFQESGGALFNQDTNPYLSRLEEENYIPEVLVVGATGEVGRLVVRRLLLESRTQVRVLVRDLFSKTLTMLGTGVTVSFSKRARMGKNQLLPLSPLIFSFCLSSVLPR